MSGGYYRLLRTDSQDGDDSEPYQSSNAHLTRAYALIHRLRSLLTTSNESFLPSRRLSRDSNSSLALSVLGGGRADGKQKKPRLVLFSSLILGFILTSLLFFFHWDTVQSFYYVQFIMTTPTAACLLDPSSPTSYVQYNPKSSNARGSIYHCISQRIPPYSNQTIPSSSLPLPGSRLRPYRPLPSWCIDSYYTNGTGCTDGQRTTFDIIWTWVNGSDPMITRARRKAVKALSGELEGEEDDDEEEEEDEEDEEENAHLYRDHDELRHSLRSVLQYFRESANKFIILTSDFEFPVTYSPLKYLLGLSKRSPTGGAIEEAASIAERRRRRRSALRRRQGVEDEEEEYEEDEEEVVEEDPFAYARLGLLPQWLKFDVAPEDLPEAEGDEPVRYDAETRTQGIGKWKDGNVELEIVHHAEVYDEYDGTVFNSNSIESQLGNLAGNKAFIYFNDDCFFTAPLSSADFHSSQFGIVFRLIAYPWMLVNPYHYPGGAYIGEWGPMEFTNYLISQRFGARRRPYPMHQVKILQGGLMDEMWDMWRDQESLNRGHKFRGLGGLHPVMGNHSWADEIDPLDGPPKDTEPDDEDDELLGRGRIKNKRSFEVFERQVEDTADSAKKEDAEDSRVPDDRIQDDVGDDYPEVQQMPVDDGDAHVIFLFTHFVIERSREGQLWSWIVASLGGDNDEFGIQQRNEAWRLLTEDAQAEQRGRGVLEIVVDKRKTMEPWRVQWGFDQTGETLKSSTYRFSSQDGYAYSYYDDQHGLEWWHEGSTDWPELWNGVNFSEDVSSRPRWSRCTIEWNTCFPTNMESASDIFKNIAYSHMECGDCILKALVRASGGLGLNALLPPPNRVFRSTDSSASPQNVPVGEHDVPPHLPLTHQWQNTDFSLNAIFASSFWGRETGSVRLRDWVQRMLERYRYVLADTDNYFNVVHNPVDAESLFAYVDDHPKVSLLTVNDDVEDYPEKTDAAMRAWFDQRFPQPAAWENPEMASHRPQPFDSIHKKRSRVPQR